MRLLLSLICIFFTFFSNSSFAQWNSKATALRARAEVNSIVYGGKLYAFMGFKDSALSVETSSEVYNPASNTWSLLANIPARKEVTHQAVALIDDNVWHIGGRVGRHPGPLTDEIWIYNITSNSWSPGPHMIDPATGDTIKWGAGGAALLGRTLHIFGGFIIDACDHDQDIYHLTLNVDDWLANPTAPAPWKNELAPLPIKRNHFGTAVLGGKIYVIGGQFGHDCGGGQDHAYAHVYDPATDTWTQLPLMPTPRSHIEGSTFAIDGKIYIAAGQATNGIGTNKVTIFDPTGNNGLGTWTDDNNLLLPTGYEGLSAKIIGNTFIIDHGGEGGSQGTRNTTYSRTISRNPIYAFGFSKGCADFNLLSGSSATKKTLLFTMDGTKDYSISSGASWITVSKNKSGTGSPTGVDVEVTANSAGLAPGQYSTSIIATGKAGGQAYSSAAYCVNLTVNAKSNHLSDTLEAESAFLHNATVSNQQTGYTGTGYVNFVNNSGDYIEWTFDRTNDSPVELSFRYANGSSGNRPLQLEVNGQIIAASLDFQTTGAWSNWSTASIDASLAAGKNIVRLTSIGASGANIDNLVWRDMSGTMEAETAVVNKAVVASNQPGYTGTGFVDYVNASGDYIEWSLDRSRSAPVAIQFRYANGSSGDRPLSIEVNGRVVSAGWSFPSTGSWTNWNETAPVIVDLVPGTNIIKLTAVGFSGANIDHLSFSEVAAPVAGMLEAEQALLNLAVVATNQPGFTGNGFVDYINNLGDFIEWTLDKSDAGPVDLNFRYANGSAANRPLKLEVNGSVVSGNLAFNPTGGWNKWANSAVTANLIAGMNKIRLTAIGYSGPNVDHLTWNNSKPTSSGLLEAELASINHAVVSSANPGYSGSGYVDYVNNIVDFVEWSLSKTGTGQASLIFHYANGSGTDRPLKLEINGQVVVPKLSFPPTGSWVTWKDVALSADFIDGVNTVRLTATGLSGPNMDYLSWSEAFQAKGLPNVLLQSTPRQTEAPAENFRAIVSPNPARDNLRLSVEGGSQLPLEIIVSDVLGRVYKILSYKILDGYQVIPVKKFPAGVYHLSIRQGNKTASVPFMVEK